MKVTILRHGEAGDAVSDRQRQLTARGNSDIHAASVCFAQACDQLRLATPQLIAHSPWRRTLQTADIMAAGLPRAARKELTQLQSGGSVAGVEKELSALSEPDDGDQHILLVSHQPLVAYLLQHFIGPTNSAPPLSPGSMVSFDLEVVAPGTGELLFWAVPPLYEVNQ